MYQYLGRDFSKKVGDKTEFQGSKDIFQHSTSLSNLYCFILTFLSCSPFPSFEESDVYISLSPFSSLCENIEMLPVKTFISKSHSVPTLAYVTVLLFEMSVKKK